MLSLLLRYGSSLGIVLLLSVLRCVPYGNTTFISEVVFMNIAEHFSAGLLVGCGVGYVLEHFGVPSALITVGASTVLGAVICDVDLPDSFIGHKVSILASLINMAVGHRTLTHSLLFLVVLSYLFGCIYWPLGIGMGLGILSHIVLDMFNGRGVAYMYPFIKKRIKWFTILD